MNKQDVFNRVVAHARKQGQQSTLKGGIGCAYRGDSGAKCFVGVLIGDDAYHAALECNAASSYKVQQALRLSGVAIDDPEDEDFLVALQKIHDAKVTTEVLQYGLTNYWEQQFEVFAADRGVTYTPPNKTA